MTTPRSAQIDFNATTFYHCISRCVRQAYICGISKENGKDYSHRKQWIVERIKLLSNCFYIDICAYAVMSNHYHLVLKASPQEASCATDKELLNRWEQVYRNDANKIRLQHVKSELYLKSIQKIRENLGSISRFMAALNEYIGTLANKEEQCRGRFWDGRFRSQALLDTGAILTAMAYVDLNPVRAKAAVTPEESDFTSIQERIKQYRICLRAKKDPNHNQPIGLAPLLPSQKDNTIDFTIEDYLQLVDETSRVIRQDKRGFVGEDVAPLLDRLSLTQSGFMQMINHLEDGYYYAVGHVENLKRFSPMYMNKNHPMRQFAEECYKEAT